MEFFIRKNSTEPILKMQLIQDGRNDFQNFHDKLENSSISFSMRNTETGAFVLLNKAAGIVSKNTITYSSGNNTEEEYYIYYRWQSSDTSIVGRYQGQFNIHFLDGSQDLVIPIREDLFINVSDSFVDPLCS